MESHPPQCGEPSLRLDGTDDTPRDEHVTLRGTVDGAVFRVSEP